MIQQGKLLIGFDSHILKQSKEDIHAQFGVKKLKEIPQLHIDVIEVPLGEEQKYKKMYLQHANVLFVDFNTIWTPF